MKDGTSNTLLYSSAQSNDLEGLKRALQSEQINNTAIKTAVQALFFSQDDNLECLRQILKYPRASEALSDTLKMRLLELSAKRNKGPKFIQAILELGMGVDVTFEDYEPILNDLLYTNDIESFKLIYNSIDQKKFRQKRYKNPSFYLSLDAIKKSKPKAVEFLLNKHDPNWTAYKSGLLMKQACQNGTPEIIDLLYTHFKDKLYNFTLISRHTNVLSYAVLSKNKNNFAHLRDHYKLDPNKVLPELCSHMVSEKSDFNLNFFKYLIESSPCIDDDTDLQNEIFSKVIRTPKPEVIEYLLSKGFDPYQYSSQGFQPIAHMLNSKLDMDGSAILKTLKLLTENGVNMDACTKPEHDNAYEFSKEHNSPDGLAFFKSYQAIIPQAMAAPLDMNSFQTLDEARLKTFNCLMTLQGHHTYNQTALMYTTFNALSCAVFSGQINTIDTLLKNSPDHFITWDDLTIKQNGHTLSDFIQVDIWKNSAHLKELFNPVLWHGKQDQMTKLYEDMPKALQDQCASVYNSTKSLIRLHQIPVTKAPIKRRSFKR